MGSESWETDVHKALSGEETALVRLVRTLTPIIQTRVARVLLGFRAGVAASRDVRQEVEDLTQDVFLILFSEDGKVLRSWQSKRGLTFENFVGLVAERQTVSILRSGKRNPWKEDPTLSADLDAVLPPVSGPEATTVSRDQLRRLRFRLTEELSPLGRQLFNLLFVDELPLPEVLQQTGMSSDAVYAWRSRLRRLVRQLLAEVSE